MAENLPLPTYLHCCFPNHLTFYLLSLNLEAVELVQEAICMCPNRIAKRPFAVSELTVHLREASKGVGELHAEPEVAK